MDRNFWEQGNSVKMNFGEHLNLFLRSKGTTVNFHKEQGNTHPPWEALIFVSYTLQRGFQTAVKKTNRKLTIPTNHNRNKQNDQNQIKSIYLSSVTWGVSAWSPEPKVHVYQTSEHSGSNWNLEGWFEPISSLKPWEKSTCKIPLASHWFKSGTRFLSQSLSLAIAMA